MDSLEWQREFGRRLQKQELLKQLDAISKRLDDLGVRHEFRVDMEALKK